jgi:hypothetical protein
LPPTWYFHYGEIYYLILSLGHLRKQWESNNVSANPLIVPQLITPILSLAGLKAYGDCPSVWIVARLNHDNACLPPTTDCLCYAPAWYLQGVAIDIASKCRDANALEDTAATLASNCALLKESPAVNSAEFSAMGSYPASDTIISSPTGSATFNPATVPNATFTSGISTVETVQAATSGVTTQPGLGDQPTESISIGPVPLPSTTASNTPTASSKNAAGSMRYCSSFWDEQLGVVGMLIGEVFWIFVLGLY